MTIEWDGRLATGIGVVDLEHRMMVMLARKLDLAIAKRMPKSVVLRIFDELIALTRFHFVSEENLMREIHFPEVEPHTRVHSHLVSQLHVIAGRINDEREPPGRALDDLWHWLIDHATHMDAKFAEFQHREQRRNVSTEAHDALFAQRL